MELYEDGSIRFEPKEAQAVVEMLKRCDAETAEGIGMTPEHAECCTTMGVVLSEAENATSTLAVLFRRPLLALRQVAGLMARLG